MGTTTLELGFHGISWATMGVNGALVIESECQEISPRLWPLRKSVMEKEAVKQ